MKKIFTLFILAIAATFVMNAGSLIVDPTTYSASPDAVTWNFTNGVSITNGSAKAYSTGTVDGISYMKFSRNVPFTMTLPAGITVDSVEITGYDNYADVESYLYEINRDTLAATTYAFPIKNGTTAVVTTHRFRLKNPATGSFIFQFKGQQTVVDFVLHYVITGLEATRANKELDRNQIVDVYSMDGRMVRKQILCGQAMNELENGMYIINNQKLVINR